MSVHLPADSTVDDVLYRGFRDLRELGHHAPGLSLERDAMRELGLLTDSGVPQGHQVQLTIFDTGHVVADLQVND